MISRDDVPPWLRSIRTRLMVMVPLLTLTPLIAVGSPRTSLVVLPVSVALAWYLGWRATRPIGELRDRLQRRKEDSLRYQEFVTDLAHELKSPLSAIRACAHTLATSDLDADRARRIGRVMEDSCHRMTQRLEELLEIALAEAPLLNPLVIDLSALARGITASYADDERYRRIDFVAAASEAVEVCGAVHLIESAVRNLVDNAASFAGDGGSVRVIVARLPIGAQVTVLDTGPGIDEADCARVFERFYTTRPKGTGLGLALVEAVATSHGGRAWVEPTPGAGAAFHMTFTHDPLTIPVAQTEGSHRSAMLCT